MDLLELLTDSVQLTGPDPVVTALQELGGMTLYILKGAVLTLQLYLVTAVFAVPLGIAAALGKISGGKWLRRLIGLYTWVMRGTPLLLQLFFVYYGLPVLGIRLSPFTAAALTFVLNYGAYMTEIFRAGVESIGRGQYEAARVLGFTYFQTMRRIVLPQALKRVIPPSINEAITLVKDTALVTVIALGEILRNATEIVTREFSITPFFIAAAIYLLITSLIVYAGRCLERRCAHYR